MPQVVHGNLIGRPILWPVTVAVLGGRLKLTFGGLHVGSIFATCGFIMRKSSSTLSLLASLVIASAATLSACATSEPTDDPEGDYFEGVEADELDPGANLDDGKSDIAAYAIPTNLPKLVAPEIIVSLKGLTVHLFDRTTGFSKVYPAGPGVLGANGRSITPVGHFKTGPNINDGWWYAPRRTNPAHFAGLPFLRLTAHNSSGQQTYALHGPITAQLVRGFVSHGCVRMARQDIIDLFWMAKKTANTPVTIQQEVEFDAAGKAVNVGMTPTLFAKGAAIPFGASVGPR
jgi:hypothetical protein